MFKDNEEEDMVLGKIRAQKTFDYQKRAYQRNSNFNPDASMKLKINQFAQDFLPHHKYKQEEDFANYILPSEDVFSGSGSGTDFSMGFSEYRFLAEKRIGLGPRLTRQPADDATRNKFKFLNIKTNKVGEKTEILDWLEKPSIDFFNQLSNAIYYERVYGTGFLIKYYTENDKDKSDLSKPPPKNQKPVGFRAYSPILMWPTNWHEFPRDPSKWKVRGGDRNSQEIHEDRVQIFMSRPVDFRWWGLSIFEPMWYPIICYFMAQIFTLRAFSRLGNSIVTCRIDEELAIDALYAKYEDLLQEMKMNGMIITNRGTEISILNTEIAVGLRDLMEIWIEDISAGTGIPVPLMLGRAQAAGMGSAMYLVFETFYWNMIAKIQHSFSDDVLEILRSAGFKLDGYRLDWALAIVKTDEQRISDEAGELNNKALEKQNALLDIQLEQEQLNLEMTEEQFLSGMIESPEEEEGIDKQKPKQDFVGELRQARAKRLVAIYRKRGWIE